MTRRSSGPAGRKFKHPICEENCPILGFSGLGTAHFPQHAVAARPAMTQHGHEQGMARRSAW